MVRVWFDITFNYWSTPQWCSVISINTALKCLLCLGLSQYFVKGELEVNRKQCVTVLSRDTPLSHQAVTSCVAVETICRWTGPDVSTEATRSALSVWFGSYFRLCKPCYAEKGKSLRGCFFFSFFFGNRWFWCCQTCHDLAWGFVLCCLGPKIKLHTETGQQSLYSMCYRHVFPGDQIGDGLVNMSSVGTLPIALPANELAVWCSHLALGVIMSFRKCDRCWG